MVGVLILVALVVACLFAYGTITAHHNRKNIRAYMGRAEEIQYEIKPETGMYFSSVKGE
jgi:hypothetical protein